MNIKKIFTFFKRTGSKSTSEGILREFIYLDEVSVYSLLASTRGPVPTEYLDTVSNTYQSEFEGGANVGTGLAGIETKARRFDAQSRGSQVTRKSIVQASFKHLYDQEKKSLAMQPVQDIRQAPTEKMTLLDIEKNLEKLQKDEWVIDPLKLKRGQMLEVEVQLEADMFFRVSTIISVFREIIEENIELFGLYSSNDISLIKSVDKMIEKLLVGLIPIRGLAVDYRALTINGKEWIVHQKYLSQLPDSTPSMPLYVVGVTEHRLFWKDIRRLLFSKSRYSTLCRLSQEGLKNTWSPIKIVDLIDSVAPELVQEMHLSQPDELAKMIKPNKSSLSIDIDDIYEIDQAQMKRALQKYADLIASEFKITLTQIDYENIEMLSKENCASFSTVDIRRKAFSPILTYLTERYKFEPDINTTSEMRNEAIRKVKAENKETDKVEQRSLFNPPVEERFLDTEFIAIYW